MERPSGSTEFRVEVKGYKYKRITQKRKMAMDRVSIYAYACIGLVGSAIIGMIVFVRLGCATEVLADPMMVSFCLQSIVP
jgi:hypothetical protein